MKRLRFLVWTLYLVRLVVVPLAPSRPRSRGRKHVIYLDAVAPDHDDASLAAPPTDIGVWDNVLPADSCTLLHDVATAHGLGHRLLVRDGSDIAQSPLEATLDQILHALHDTAPYVEYWTRQEWRHIEAHADVDEYRAKTQRGGSGSTDDNLRYPTAGHVLYLQVGPQVRGPTCLFPNCRSGGDLAQAENDNNNLSVLTVPAVSGRLLRFPGHWLHAVPRPTDIWMLPFVQGSPDFSADFVRSVVLFNTWTDEPPLQVEPLSAKNYPEHDSIPLVNDMDKWQELETVDSPGFSNFTDRVKVWLLGDLRRRNYTMRTVPVYSNGDILRQALQEKHQPRSTPLSQNVVEA